MADDSQGGLGKAIAALDMAINGLNVVRAAACATPVNPIFGSVAILLVMIRVSSLPLTTRYSGLTHSQNTVANEQDYVDLGLSCAAICEALERGMGGKKLEDLSKPVRDAINQLTT